MRHGVRVSSPEQFEHLEDDEAEILRGLTAPVRDDYCPGCDDDTDCLC